MACACWQPGWHCAAGTLAGDHGGGGGSGEGGGGGGDIGGGGKGKPAFESVKIARSSRLFPFTTRCASGEAYEQLGTWGGGVGGGGSGGGLTGGGKSGGIGEGGGSGGTHGGGITGGGTGGGDGGRSGGLTGGGTGGGCDGGDGHGATSPELPEKKNLRPFFPSYNSSPMARRKGTLPVFWK